MNFINKIRVLFRAHNPVNFRHQTPPDLCQKEALIYFAALAYLFTVSTAPDRLVSQIRLDVNLIIFHLEF
jgi:hypothetical protein